MIKTINLMPRRSGKTTLGLYEFCKNPKDTLFLNHSTNLVNNLFSRHGEIKDYKLNFKVQGSDLRGFSFNKCIIDEYFIFSKKNQKRLYNELFLNEIRELIIFSTLDFDIATPIFDFVYKMKKDNRPMYVEEYENFKKSENFDDLQ